MKHAYLILAHSQFEVLDLFVQALDDERNDIYIHFDKKVQRLPKLETKGAKLTYIEERFDIRWGHISMIRAEFALLEAALKDNHYAYLHLLSGVDLPLKSQNYIHDFFKAHQGKEFVGYYNGGDDTSSLEHKVQRRHIFSDSFKGNGLMHQVKRVARYLFLRLQIIAGLRRNEGIEFKKGTQWCSITEEFARYILQHKQETEQIYADSFCCDEIVIQTLLWHSPFSKNIFDRENEFHGCMRHIGWQNNQLLDFTSEDYETLRQSEALFARKFNNRDLKFLARLLEHC